MHTVEGRMRAVKPSCSSNPLALASGWLGSIAVLSAVVRPPPMMVDSDVAFIEPTVVPGVSRIEMVWMTTAGSVWERGGKAISPLSSSTSFDSTTLG
ncbi:MAG: hypothetical protein IPJ34_09735 [Myxococcales bacterium]|nr:hypothetical protein [Myxococcales bacterium]